MNKCELNHIENNTFSYNQAITEIDKDVISSLEDLCASVSQPFIRVNLHANHDDKVQQMIMVMKKGAQIKPHFQDFGYVSYQVLEGEARLNLHSIDNKNIAIELSNKKTRFIRVDRKITRSMTAEADYFSFLEICDGPFKAENTRWLAA